MIYIYIYIYKARSGMVPCSYYETLELSIVSQVKIRLCVCLQLVVCTG